MKAINNHFLFLLVLGMVCTISNAQEKFEKEYRLKEDNVPGEALNYIRFAEINEKVSWYFEENLLGNSVEAKFKINKRKFSVEFDTHGFLQDIEIQIKWEEIDKEIRGVIYKELGFYFESFKIQKIQVQYIGVDKKLLKELVVKQTANYERMNYEIVVKGKKEGGSNLYELTFSEQGILLDTRKILFKNSDHLEY